MSSGSYLPPPGRAVEIPEPHGGGTRILGVPTVADRVAQTVVARRLEVKVETIFHPDSYGYRPGRAPQDAVEVCRRRCWFTFLGFTFRQRRSRNKDGKQFNSFNPAISKPALRKISAVVRSWRLHNRTGRDFVEVARDITPRG